MKKMSDQMWGKLSANLKNILCILMIFLISLSCCFAKDKKTKDKPNIVASTTWTAAFADLAGADSVTVIAPANLKHPPEYEISVSDIITVSKSDYFIFAGFERMMETIGNSAGSAEMIKIKCDNSIETVKENAEKISKILGTEKESKKRVNKYIKAIEDGRKKVESLGLKGAKVLCHKHQVYLAEELGFNVVKVFGPGPVTSKQIADAKSGNYDFIIDNVHNPVGKPLAEVASGTKYIVWRNFPEETGRDILLHVVQNNIDLIVK